MCSKRYSFAVDSFKYLGIAAASQSSFNAIFIVVIIYTCNILHFKEKSHITV